jgi:hypothetical protein
MTLGRTVALAAALIAAPSAPALAVGAMAVDDASLADWGTIAVETYTQVGGGLSQWVQPAMQLMENFQLTLGAGLDAGGPLSSGLAVQGKTMLRSPDADGVAVALSLGTTIQPSTSGMFQGLALNVPVTEAFGADGALRFHQNLGVALDWEAGAALTWGLAGEWAVSEALSALAEVYGQTGGDTAVQAGLAYWLTPDAWQLNGEVQLTPGLGDTLVTVGMAFVGPWSAGAFQAP